MILNRRLLGSLTKSKQKFFIVDKVAATYEANDIPYEFKFILQG